MRTAMWPGRLKNVAGRVGRLLPAAVLSVFIVVIAAAFLGATWGSIAFLGWFAVGLVVLSVPGERGAVRAVLGYRPSSQSLLAADVAALAPERRVNVYVAPGLVGLFAVGGATVVMGSRSVGNGVRTEELSAQAAAAVADLRVWRTRTQLAMCWWALPWLGAIWVVGIVVRPRWMARLRVLALVYFTIGVLFSLRQGQTAAAARACA